MDRAWHERGRYGAGYGRQANGRNMQSKYVHSAANGGGRWHVQECIVARRYMPVPGRHRIAHSDIFWRSGGWAYRDGTRKKKARNAEIFEPFNQPAFSEWNGSSSSTLSWPHFSAAKHPLFRSRCRGYIFQPSHEFLRVSSGRPAGSDVEHFDEK